MFHTFIDKDLQGVSKYLGPDDEEHELGEVTSTGAATPMITGYESELAGQGTCSLSYSHDSYTTDPTYCTNQSLEATFKDG